MRNSIEIFFCALFLFGFLVFLTIPVLPLLGVRHPDQLIIYPIAVLVISGVGLVITRHSRRV